MPTSIPKFKITKSVDSPSNDEYITDSTSLFFNKLHPVLIDLFIHHQNTIYNRTRLFPSKNIYIYIYIYLHDLHILK